MKKKIALVGLNKFNNMGDQVIAETMNYIVGKNSNEVETYFVDISPYDSYCKKHLSSRFKVFNFIRKIESIVKSFVKSEKLVYFLQYISWKIKLYKYYKEELSKADAIIFSGGGFIKYRTQELNYLVDLITKIANENDIPVMMSGMGVEGYSETDIRCQKLKDAINRDCVKTITTRDNLTLLNEKYIRNKSIKTALVGDPAFYTPECYGVTKKGNISVGVGVIRSDIFLKYGTQVTEEEVMNLYKNVIKELDSRNIGWKLFSNGLTSDYEFGIKLLKSLGIDKDKKYLPRPNNTTEFVNTISEFDAIIAARLHACITAYSLDIPAVGFIWNEKLELFGELIGQNENYIPVNNLNGKYILDIYESIKSNSYDVNQRNELKLLTEKYITDFIHIL